MGYYDRSRIEVRLRGGSLDHRETPSHTVKMNKHHVEKEYKAEVSSSEAFVNTPFPVCPCCRSPRPT